MLFFEHHSYSNISLTKQTVDKEMNVYLLSKYVLW